jgi:S1-C subfamily serine protease
MADVLGPLEGIVGLSFFGRYRVTIDYQKRELTFVPTEFRPPDLMKKMTAMLMDPNRGKTQVVAPAGVWGFRADKDRGDEEPGVTVKEVFADGPAAKAGLKVGDRVLTLDDRWTDTVADLFSAAAAIRPGTGASLRVRRGDEEITLNVRPKAGL